MGLVEFLTRPLGAANRPPTVVTNLRSAASPDGDLVSGLRIASDILSRAGLARHAGKTFGGKRDFYEALGYARSLTVEDMRDRYERGDIAARIVDTYPKETWAEGGPELVEDEDPEVVTPWEQQWLDFAERLSLWQVIKRADVLCGLGPYSIILIGAAGKLDTPLPRMSSLDAVLYLAPYAADDAMVHEWDADSASPRFGLPASYKLKRQTTVVNGLTTDRIVHWSRVIHVADNLLDDRVSGRPLLTRCWNRLDDLDKVVGGGSEAFWLRVNGGTIFSVDKDVKVEDSQLNRLKEQAEEFAHGLRRTLAARGFSATQLDSDVSNFNNQVEALVSLLSSATGIPQRILLGSERGELASSQDAKAWDKRIAERRTDFGEPLIKDLVRRLTEAGAVAETEYDIRWPEYEELDQTQKADVATKWAELNGKAGEIVVTGAEIRDRILRLPKIDEAALAEAEEREQARREEELAAEQERMERFRQNPSNADNPENEE